MSMVDTVPAQYRQQSTLRYHPAHDSLFDYEQAVGPIHLVVARLPELDRETHSFVSVPPSEEDDDHGELECFCASWFGAF
jgi:hypothetical protein